MSDPASYDVIADAKARFTEDVKPYYEKARTAHELGELVLAWEKVLEPYNGHGFELDKGQTVRFELIDAPQIIDTVYLVKSRPTQEWADSFSTATYGAFSLFEGTTYYSNTPYTRPLLTIIKDTADYERLRNQHGELAAHSFIYPGSARCNEGIWESFYGVPNANNCNMNIVQGLLEVAGEEVARATKLPNAFMHYQPHAFDKAPMNYTLYSSKGVFKRGDYVELLAHDDLLVAVSLCPYGDQHELRAITDSVCTPIKVAVYEGKDGPLETFPDPHYTSMDAVDFVKAGRPGMVRGKIAGRTSETWFE